MHIKSITFLFFLNIIMEPFFGYEFIKLDNANCVIGNNTIKVREIGEKQPYYPYEEHEVKLSTFEIGKYLITNDEYFKFRKETGYKTAFEKYRNSKKDLAFNNIINKNNPCVKISVFDAIAYCQWFTDKYGNETDNYRLPTNCEWEYAAMGNEKQKYPWGNSAKILSSLNTDEVTMKKDVSITLVEEDESCFGVRNLLGGNEIVLDNYILVRENYKNLNSINPVIFYSGKDIEFMSRGGVRYNDLSDELGLFFSSWANFDYPTAPFRMVKDSGIIFNKGEQDECIYFINRGISKNNQLAIYKSPNKNDSPLFITDSKDFYILFKTTFTEDNFYRVYYKEGLDEFGRPCWHSGWIETCFVEITNKKWYED